MAKLNFRFSFVSFSFCSLKLQPLSKIIVISSTIDEDIFKIFEKHPILPNSEIFYFKNESDGIVVKQSKF